MHVEKVNIALSQEEAVVLFEFLNRLNQQLNDSFFEDQAEQCVLWDIVSVLENQLEKPFNGNYLNFVRKARQMVRDRE
jgi:hypothetical protein